MEAAQEALYMLSALEQAGYEAYLVGGCVRDALLGQPPKDYDIATQARPPQATKALEAAGCRVHPTGIAHGTVTAGYRGLAVEVTAYRRDGEYLDHRHPSQVRFVSQLQEDLLRRDFTCNALAFHPDRGLVYLVGGLPDLRAGLLRCVGDPPARFEEDALRVLRALRFASVLGFAIEAETAAAVHESGLCLEEYLQTLPPPAKTDTDIVLEDAAAPVQLTETVPAEVPEASAASTPADTAELPGEESALVNLSQEEGTREESPGESQTS